MHHIIIGTMSIICVRCSKKIASFEQNDLHRFLDLPDPEVSWPFSDLAEQVSVLFSSYLSIPLFLLQDFLEKN